MRILETNNYNKFVLSPFQRDVKKTWGLEASFRCYGWRDAHPIEVIRQPDGKLMIVAGHHRFYVARKLGMMIKYIEVKEAMQLSVDEGTIQKWTLQQCLEGRVREGLPAYIRVRDYHEKTGIGLSSCISMLAGDSAGSGNWGPQFKDGLYTLGDPTHANIVGRLVIHCREKGCAVSNAQLLVNAFSKLAWAEGFDPEVMRNKIALYPELLKKQASKDDYVRLLADIYNRKSQTRVPLEHNAEEAARKRSPLPKKKKKPWLPY